MTRLLLFLTLMPMIASADSVSVGVEWLRNCLSVATTETRKNQAVSYCTSDVFYVCEYLDARDECAAQVEGFAIREISRIMKTVPRESGETEVAKYLYQKRISIIEEGAHMPVCDVEKVGFPGCEALRSAFKYQVALGLEDGGQD